ncbi:hypothetical protein LCGC14_1807380 [marine sediment metagenome]|uniref:Uncharacterized protein n=2 Tax=root TaxID=1 RepID=A0A831VPS3_9FLAO|nr:hypothetical protein [Pricia antarctica]
MQIDHKVITDYFQYLATKHKKIAGYFRMDLTEIQGAFRGTAEIPCLVLESHEGDLSGSSRQQTVNDRTFAFTIYTKPRHGDYDEQNQRLADSETIGLSVIARMKHDATLPVHFLYNKFQVETVSYAKVGPVFNEHLYGYRFVGSIMGNEPLKVNVDDWLDGPEICVK